MCGDWNCRSNPMNKPVQMPAIQFSFFRMVFGSYLCVHFLQLIPSSPDIWSRQGMLGNASLNFTYGRFPNILNILDTPTQIKIFTGLLVVLALMITVGYRRRLAALLLWYGWACLFHRNNLISNPGIPMVGWLLLALTLIPTGEPLTLSGKPADKKWTMPPILFWGAWWITAIAYTISGFDKFMAPSWRDGSAMLHLLNNPLARDSWFREFLLSLPLEVLQVKTWLALALEMSFGFLCIFSKTRALAWFLIMGMHFGILAVVDFADLTLGVIMIHLFTFDPGWFHPKIGAENRKIVFFDGVCGLCNGVVNFLLDNDLHRQLLFSPLQGNLACTSGVCREGDALDTIVFEMNGVRLTKSRAAIMIAAQLGGMWAFARIFLLLPVFFRDFLYRLVAGHRYRIFGKREFCRMPTPDERSRFLD